MSSPFSQTMESRRMDLFKWWRIGLVTAMLLFGLWAHWLFTAPVTSHQTTREFRVAQHESRSQKLVQQGATHLIHEYRQRLVIAVFPADAMRAIQPDQPALVYLDRDGDLPATVVPATVAQIVPADKPNDADSAERRGEVHLHAESPVDEPSPFGDRRTGFVKIEVAHTTPAGVMLRAAGIQNASRPVTRGPIDTDP